jgi:hypothetical protein
MRSSTVIAFVILLSAGLAHSQNLLINGSFEVVDASAPPFFIRSSSSTPGWTQILDGVDLTHNDYTQGPAVLLDASDGVQFLDLNQVGSLGGLEQVVVATVGLTYRLDLDTAAWAQNAIGGTIGYELFDPRTAAVLASGDFTDPVGGVWTTRSLQAAATYSLMGVRIQGLVATQAGMGLDNVRLTLVPEPSVVGFGSLALIMTWFRFIVRRKQSTIRR